MMEGNAFNKGVQRKVKSIDRQKRILAPIEVDQVIPKDHPARAIWEFIGRLNLEHFYQGIQSIKGMSGRPAFAPELMISLWVLAYSEGINSAREISCRCQYDPPYQWMTGAERINYHSLADFRVKNSKALDDLFIQVLGILSAAGLVTFKRVMHDGTKIRANAGADSFRSENHLQEHLKLARQQVELMNNTMGEVISARVAQARKRAAIERQRKHEKALKELEIVRSEQRSQEEKKRPELARPIQNQDL